MYKARWTFRNAEENLAIEMMECFDRAPKQQGTGFRMDVFDLELFSRDSTSGLTVVWVILSRDCWHLSASLLVSDMNSKRLRNAVGT